MGIRFSNYGRAASNPSPVNAMNRAFASDFRDGIDVNLGVGFVNEDTIPSDLIREAVDAVLSDSATYRQPLNYGDPRGTRALLAAVRQFHSRMAGPESRGLDWDGYAIAIGGCGATSLLDGLADVLTPGIVVTADPIYYIYGSALERKGYSLLGVPEDEEGPVPEAVAEAVAHLGDHAQDIAFFYFVTVNNPTCSCLSNARRHALVELVARISKEQGRAIPLLFDTAYEAIRHDPSLPPFESGLAYDANDLVYEFGTVSKIVAPGLRMGYIIGPNSPLMDAIVQRTSDVGLSPPTLNQEIVAYILKYHLDTQLERVNAGYRKKAAVMRAGIDEHFGDAVAASCGGRAGFYYYLTLGDVETHTASALFRHLTRTTGDAAWDGPAETRGPRVVYLPGEHCVQRGGALDAVGRRQFRLSYGFESSDGIKRAMALIGEAIRATRANL